MQNQQKIFREWKLHDDTTEQIQCGRENETGEKL